MITIIKCFRNLTLKLTLKYKSYSCPIQNRNRNRTSLDLGVKLTNCNFKLTDKK